MGSTVTLGLIQLACGPDEKENTQKTIERIYEAASRGAQIICLQELFAAQYFPQYVKEENYSLSKPADDETLSEKKKIAAERSVVLIVPFYEKTAPGVYFNSAAVIDANGELLGITRKNHIPDGPQYHEKYYFVPGNTGYPVYKTKYGVIGVGICWDEWFPEVARILTLQGAQILFYPSAIGSEPNYPDLSTRAAWEKAISAHGISNGVFVAAINRVGREQGMAFYGGSFVSDPMGNILQSLHEDEGVLIETVNLQEIERARNLLQFLRDRRPETYHLLLKQEAFIK